MDTLITMNSAPRSAPTPVADIESRIAALVARLVTATGLGDGTCSQVLGSVREQAITSSAGGKRLRASLALAAYNAGRLAQKAPESTPDHEASWIGAADGMLDIACAIEVFQTAALVHDDIIDDSDLRRGKPSAHRALSTLTHSAAIGRGLGLMIGDILATGSIDIVRNACASMPQKQAQSLLAAFTNMQREVSIGQILDLAIELSPLTDPQDLTTASLNVFRWKTASYTTIAPIELGLIASGRDAASARAMALSIGEPLGIAFQLADDVLDVVGYSANTGKPVGGDIREGKRAVLLADTLQALPEQDRNDVIAMYESDSRSDDDVCHCIALMKSTGAVERSYERINQLWHETGRAIDSIDLDDEGKHILREVCRKFVSTAIPQGA